MEAAYGAPLGKSSRQQWLSFLSDCHLTVEAEPDFTVLLRDGEDIVAAGSRQGTLLKYIAVAEHHRGEDLTAAVITHLRREALSHGIAHLLLYTKPQNEALFAPLFFYPVTKTQDVLLMENQRGGIASYVSGLAAPEVSGVVGAAVMNCNPFTLGHRYLIETAARDCALLHVFVLSEEQALFPAADRLQLVQEGTADLPNVLVHPTGPYLLSSATFPTYFLPHREQASDIQCQLDLQIFTEHYAPPLHITRRYVGTEPYSPLTNAYNRAMQAALPPQGIQVVELPRKQGTEGAISASAVRALLGQNQPERLRAMVPETTFRYLCARNLI